MATAASWSQGDIRSGSRVEAGGPERPGALRHIPQLDGLRALAILLVITHHYGLSLGFVAPAEFSVRLFFVLSGFLITSIILHQKQVSEVEGRDFRAFVRNFYARRALRLLPALYLGIAAGVALGIGPLVATWAWHAFYLSNVYFSLQGGFQFPIGHLWTLAVEEQYYLLWPLILLMIPRRFVLPGVIALIVAAPLFRMTGYLMGYERVSVGILLPSCLDTFGFGSLLAIVSVYRPGVLSALNPRITTAVAILSVIALLAIEFAREAIPLTHFVIGDIIRAVLALWMVHGAIKGFGGWAGRALESFPMQWIGKTSYCLYIIHQPAYFLTQRFFELRGIDVEPQTLIAAIAFVLAVAVSSASWKLIEEPINRLKRHFPMPVRGRVIA